MEARDELSVILIWLDDFRPINPKRINQIERYIQDLFTERSELGGQTIRLKREIEELKKNNQ